MSRCSCEPKGFWSEKYNEKTGLWGLIWISLLEPRIRKRARKSRRLV